VPQTLHSSLEVARRALWSDKAWLWYAVCERKAGGFYRLVRDGKHRTFSGVTWQACMFGFDVPPATTEGRLGGVELVIPNVGRVPGALIELQRELLGVELTVYVSLEGQLPTAGLAFTQVITGASVTEKTVSLRCQDTGAMRMVPQKAFTRDRWPALAPVGKGWAGRR